MFSGAENGCNLFSTHCWQTLYTHPSGLSFPVGDQVVGPSADRVYEDVSPPLMGLHPWSQVLHQNRINKEKWGFATATLMLFLEREKHVYTQMTARDLVCDVIAQQKQSGELWPQPGACHMVRWITLKHNNIDSSLQYLEFLFTQTAMAKCPYRYKVSLPWL